MRKQESQSLSDILGEFGITETELTDQVAAVKAMHKMAPCFRFNLPPRDAYLMLYKLYQEEVLERYGDFISDDNTKEEVAKVIQHLTQP